LTPLITRIRHLATRFALLIGVTAIVPLLAYGFISLQSLRSGTRDSIVAGNANVATRAAEEIRRYVTDDVEILATLAANLQNTGLQTWQQDRILKNYILDFHEFREITLFDEAGGKIATSRIGEPKLTVPKDKGVVINNVTMSSLRVDDDLLPTATLALHMVRLNQPSGWLVGEFNLEEMWRTVDRIRIGAHGYAMVVAPDGALVAHGDPDKKALVAQTKNMGANPLVSAMRVKKDDAPVSAEYVNEDGRQSLGVAARIPTLGWTIIVEQPTSEAYAAPNELRRQLLAAIAVALLVMVTVGYFFGHSFINPILTLKRATQVVASGQFTERVRITTGDEFGELGDAFNTMADKLVELTEDVKRQERQATFGRMAAGIVHDLSHPIQNIGNSTRLLVRDDSDPEARQQFLQTIERELTTLKRFMDDLRNVIKPKPVERFPLDVNGSVAEIVEPMRAEGERHEIVVEGEYAPGPLVIDGDRFALGRVYRNLITNAIQATPPGGRVIVRTSRVGEQIEVSVTDTGSGIAPERLAKIFDDYVTTKRRGLGLGLAITKRIVEQLEGTITVASEIGRGTSFTLRFPARDDRTEQAAAS
jgi:signal transduction histidine kinase